MKRKGPSFRSFQWHARYPKTMPAKRVRAQRSCLAHCAAKKRVKSTCNHPAAPRTCCDPGPDAGPQVAKHRHHVLDPGARHLAWPVRLLCHAGRLLHARPVVLPDPGAACLRRLPQRQLDHARPGERPRRRAAAAVAALPPAARPGGTVGASPQLQKRVHLAASNISNIIARTRGCHPRRQQGQAHP